MANNKNALAMLTAAASALAGVSTHAAEVATDFQFGVRHHDYKEDGLADLTGTEQDRYDIKVNQFSLVAPINESMDLSVSYQHEKMSGASPWFTVLDGEGNTQQIMSGASIEDTRTDVSAKLRYLDGLNTYGFVVATSDEDDYESLSFGVEYSKEAEDKMSSWSVAADVSNDDIMAVDPDIYTTRPSTEQSKRSSSLFASYTQILNKNSLVQFGAGVSRKQGFLSDPYKMVFVEFNLLGDSRPESRTAKTLSARYRYFIDASDSALHLDYRFYDDNWGVDSHTIEAKWYQNLPWQMQLVPSIRAYSQSEAEFYDDYYHAARNDGFYSNDYRLSEFGATTLGLTLVKSFDSWSITASAEKYNSGGSTFLANADEESPALLDFKLISIGFNFSF